MLFAGDDPKVSDMFAVLRVDTVGDSVEGVSEVTPTHVKLVRLVFSLRGVMIKEALRDKVNCVVLIFKTTDAALTLHVYLLPDDPAVKQVVFVYRKHFVRTFNTISIQFYLCEIDKNGHFSQAVEKTEASHGSKIIGKPKPNKSLKCKDLFFLTTDAKTAEISPDVRFYIYLWILFLFFYMICFEHVSY